MPASKVSEVTQDHDFVIKAEKKPDGGWHYVFTISPNSFDTLDAYRLAKNPENMVPF